MLANDSTTVAVKVPIWLTEKEIATLETKYGCIIPKEPLDQAYPMARPILSYLRLGLLIDARLSQLG